MCPWQKHLQHHWINMLLCKLHLGISDLVRIDAQHCQWKAADNHLNHARNASSRFHPSGDHTVSAWVSATLNEGVLFNIRKAGLLNGKVSSKPLWGIVATHWYRRWVRHELHRWRQEGLQISKKVSFSKLSGGTILIHMKIFVLPI